MADRRDYYFRQRVTQAELDEGFAELENADRDIVADLLGFGFVTSVLNPATVSEDAPESLNVVVSRLLGYDQLGRRLHNDLDAFQGGADLGAAPQTVDVSTDENAASTAVAGAGNEKTISIFVEFERKLTDPRLDGNAATVFFVVDESVKFNVVQSAEAPIGTSVPPPLRPDQLLLCDITRVFGQTTIDDADISVARFQAFELQFIHGARHVETGTDPIPNATPAVGGLLSAADKTKLDDVTFTPAGIANRVGKTLGFPFQPANVVAPAATTLDVTGAMAGKSAGGSSTAEGVATQSAAPNNRVLIKDNRDDDFVDTAGGRNDKVYGRITVDNEGAPTVWTLSFFTLREDTGVETAFNMTPFAGQAIKWAVQEMHFLHNVPSFSPFWSVPSDQVAAELPYPIKAQDSGAVAIGTAFSHLREGTGIDFSDLGGNVLQVALSILASKGLQVVGGNSIQPASGHGVFRVIGYERDDTDVTAAAASTPLPPDTIVVPNNANRIALLVVASSLFGMSDDNGAGFGEAHLEILKGGTDVETAGVGYNIEASAATTGGGGAIARSTTLIAITGVAAQNPGNFEWGDMVRTVGPDGYTSRNRMLFVAEIVGNP